uniref:Uncharacterized protein n=1 Tax=Arundo donax TaxID=35708 RepID=A0A0A9HIN0_ARUDO
MVLLQQIIMKHINLNRSTMPTRNQCSNFMVIRNPTFQSFQQDT